MSSLRQRFGKKLLYLRHQINLTQEQLAQKAEISVDFLSLMERGINAPSFETLEKLSLALEVPVKDFFDFKSEQS
ncbi:MAG: XRE family transcriptional regulator [Chloroflexi bacterium HGW-Chloroflexi-2]|jgi:transcriptional regulator with XRE-family HTH domain|nr:MAG: XRE family transcriptional regulator [Chloroflexi bacterium HGW-Chloroflexi-2]